MIGKNLVKGIAGATLALAVGTTGAFTANAVETATETTPQVQTIQSDGAQARAVVQYNAYWSFSNGTSQGHVGAGTRSDGYRLKIYGPKVGPGWYSYGYPNYNVYKYNIAFGFYL